MYIKCVSEYIPDRSKRSMRSSCSEEENLNMRKNQQRKSGRTSIPSISSSASQDNELPNLYQKKERSSGNVRSRQRIPSESRVLTEISKPSKRTEVNELPDFNQTNEQSTENVRSRQRMPSQLRSLSISLVKPAKPNEVCGSSSNNKNDKHLNKTNSTMNHRLIKTKIKSVRKLSRPIDNGYFRNIGIFDLV